MRQAKTPSRTLSICLLAGMAVVAIPSWAQSSPSGFIQNMPADIKADPAGPGSKSWQSSTANLANYSKVLLEPLTIYVAPDSKEKGLNPDALKSLSDGFRKLVTDQLEPNYPVVDKSGQGVLVLRPALTNVYLEKKSRGLLSYTPIGLAVYAGRDAYSKEFSLEKAALEVEVLDGATGERIGVLIDQAPEKSGGNDADKLDWSRIESTFKFYAQRLMKRLDASRGK